MAAAETAIGALLISGLGLWNGWRSSDEPKPAATKVIEQRSAVPLALHGRVEDEGKALVLSPVEAGHTLDSLTMTVAGKPPLSLGSDGRLMASSIEELVPPPTRADRSGTIPVIISARYIEAGKDRNGGGRYRLSYRWAGGGLFGGRSLRLTRFSRG